MKIILVATILVLFTACGVSADVVPAPAPNHPHVAWTSVQDMTFDENGVVVVPYASGLEYNPLSIARLASQSYAYKNYETFWTQVDWLMANKSWRGFTVWEYDYEWCCGTQPPWVAGMAQGEIMVVLLQAYSLSGDDIYLDTANDILPSFWTPVSQGGVLRPGMWYELYACDSCEFTKILNGHMFAVEALEYHWRYTGNPLSKQLYEAGLRTIERELPNFDLETWGMYSPTRVASPGYNGVMVRQLFHFWEVTGNQVFFDYAAKWQNLGEAPSTGGVPESEARD